MQIPSKLLKFFEKHFPDALSFGLETKRPNQENGTLQGWRNEATWNQEDLSDPETCAEQVVEAAVVFLEEMGELPYRAFMRVPKAVSSDGRVRCEFKVPKQSDPTRATAVAAVSALLPDANPRDMALFQFILGIANTERERADDQIEIQREQLAIERSHHQNLLSGITRMIEETRKDRIALLQEIREERKNSDDRIGPIIEHAASALSNAAELVRVHQDQNTQVQLAKLEMEAKEKDMEFYLEIGKQALGFIKGRKKKQQQTQPHQQVMPEMQQDDAPPPAIGLIRELFMLLERMSDEQIEQTKTVIGEAMFKVLDDAAHSGDDDQTIAALDQFKAEAEKDPKKVSKMLKLAGILGDELSETFVDLITKEHVKALPAAVVEMIQPDGFVRGLRDCGLNALDDDKRIALAELLDAPLAGILEAAATGNDEVKALRALCSLGAALNALAADQGEALAEERFVQMSTLLGVDPNTFADLVARAADRATKMDQEQD